MQRLPLSQCFTQSRGACTGVQIFGEESEFGFSLNESGSKSSLGSSIRGHYVS